MIEKLKTINPYDETEIDMDVNSVAGLVYEDTPLVRKINELVDAVNDIQKEREAECFEIQEWIGILEAVRESVNVHEKQIDELQMKVEPHKCEPAENTQDENPRCPFCGEELYYAQEIDGGFDILTCNCPHGIWLFGNDKMWYNLEKATTELKRTRKALDVAVDALKDNLSQANFTQMLDASRFHCIRTKCELALAEITALEQKD